MKAVRSSFPCSTMDQALLPPTLNTFSTASSAPKIQGSILGWPFASPIPRWWPHLGFKPSEWRRAFSLYAASADSRRARFPHWRIRSPEAFIGFRFARAVLRDMARLPPVLSQGTGQSIRRTCHTRPAARFRQAAVAVIVGAQKQQCRLHWF
jgi:hypothetical protein